MTVKPPGDMKSRASAPFLLLLQYRIVVASVALGIGTSAL